MKNVHIPQALLILLLTGPLATGQAGGQTTAHTEGQRVVETLHRRCLNSLEEPQTQDRECGDDSPSAYRILAARSQYALADASDQRHDSALAQVSGQPPAPRFPQGPGYPPPAYAGMWAPEGNGRATAIGALVGFGLGAAAGASANTDARSRVAASLLVGSIGALLGAAVGHAASVFPVRRPSRSGWPYDEARNSHHKAWPQAAKLREPGAVRSRSRGRPDPAAGRSSLNCAICS